MIVPTQLHLLPLPRPIEPGEPHRCQDCARYDEAGSWGPRGLGAIRLRDGTEHAAELSELWFCGTCAPGRWASVHPPEVVARRLERLAVFRELQAEGLRGADLFAAAESRLKEES